MHAGPPRVPLSRTKPFDLTPIAYLQAKSRPLFTDQKGNPQACPSATPVSFCLQKADNRFFPVSQAHFRAKISFHGLTATLKCT